jgi:hypothetical protein
MSVAPTMQTFLPVPGFRSSARMLDLKRLGKQRVEAIQVVRGLVVEGYGWRHHPAVTMWRGHLEALGRYGLDCCEVWVERGFADTCAGTITDDLASAGITRVRTQGELAAAGELPPWLGDDAFHRTHRSALLRKAPDHYAPLFTDDLAVPDDLPYLWPGGAATAGETAAATEVG